MPFLVARGEDRGWKAGSAGGEMLGACPLISRGGGFLRGQARESTKPFRFEFVFPSAKIFIDAPFSIASLEGREI